MRVVAALVIIAVLAAAAAFFADHPGRVAIVWQGWELETSVGVLIAASVAAVIVLLLAWRFVSWLLRSPRNFLRQRRERRRRAGYRALTEGMAAIAADEPGAARRSARKADALLADPPLTLLLSAQAAQLDGDEAAAKRCFTAMLDRPETELLGLRGLLDQALREGDHGAALRLAERAKALRPNARWTAPTLFELEAREGRWQAALATLGDAAKRRLVPGERARHHRGVILYELSRTALAQGDRRGAISLAGDAQNLVPDLAAPAAYHARLLLGDGRAGPAAKAIEQAWRTLPHPELAQVYGEVHADQAPLARFKSVERLAGQNPTARESQLALAEAALAAELWGEARRHLDMAFAMPPGPTVRLCRMMAQLEEADGGDLGRMREWLDRAVAATPDPRYLCAKCGGESLEWRSRCPHCGRFDTLAWRSPLWAAPSDALPPPRASAAAG
ncbi:MAG TPA: heme biosynthesis HemY N-terminal domain-containing protein [Stellaceae bacterium]